MTNQLTTKPIAKRIHIVQLGIPKLVRVNYVSRA